MAEQHIVPIDDTQATSNGNGNGNRWWLCGKRYHRNQLTFFAQVIPLYVCIIASIINLSLRHEPHTLWITLLSSSLGYLLPNPSLKQDRDAGAKQ